jgi:serine/threonine protein kinase
MFNVYSTLGTGTFGGVRQVKLKDDPRGHVYALKMLKKEMTVKLKQVDHIKSEKNILKMITHPFIVSL